MGMPLFRPFSEMINNLPAKGVMRAVHLQRQMLEEDLAYKRTLPIKEVNSILAFCDFLEKTIKGCAAPCVSLPIQHVGFYRATVKRLVEDGILPFQANELFDASFSISILKPLKT